ncbi:MAG: alpha/beta hydrolase [Hyphomonadaceae bacterium]
MSEEDATVEVAGVRIPGRIASPVGAPKASVLMLPGSLFSDVDGDFPTWNVRPHVYRDLAQHFAALGIATMRQAKIGPGTGSETLDATAAVAHRRFAERVVVARAALRRLRSAAPAAPLFVAGHSEGALVASLLCADQNDGVEGLISLSGPALRILDIMRVQTAAMAPGGDMSVFDQAIADIRAARPLTDAARSNPMLAGLASMPPQALDYIRDVDAVDPCAAIARAPLRTLLVQGGRDQSVTPEQVDQLAAARAGLPTETVRFPELQHFYKRADPGLDAMASFALSTESDPSVAAAIADWIG